MQLLQKSLSSILQVSTIDIPDILIHAILNSYFDGIDLYEYFISILEVNFKSNRQKKFH